MRTFFGLLICFFSKVLFAQNFAEMLARFDSIEASRCREAVAEFSARQPKNWLDWLPSLGVGYTPSGSPRPTLSYSLAQIFEAKTRRREREAKQKAEASKCASETANRRAEIVEKIRSLEILRRDIAEDRRIFEEIDAPIFVFWTKKADVQDILPIEFLEKKKQFEAARERIRRREIEAETLELNIFSVTYW